MTKGGQMKTTKQIADELGVSKQQVYRYIKKHCIKESRQENGTMYYDETAETLIIQGFSEKTESTEAEQKHTNDTALDAVIKMLQKELEAKDRQIEELQAALKREQELHTSAQGLHAREQQLHAATLKQLPAPAQEGSENSSEPTQDLEPRKKGFFNRWKKNTIT